MYLAGHDVYQCRLLHAQQDTRGASTGNGCTVDNVSVKNDLYFLRATLDSKRHAALRLKMTHCSVTEKMCAATVPMSSICRNQPTTGADETDGFSVVRPSSD